MIVLPQMDRKNKRAAQQSMQPQPGQQGAVLRKGAGPMQGNPQVPGPYFQQQPFHLMRPVVGGQEVGMMAGYEAVNGDSNLRSRPMHISCAPSLRSETDFVFGLPDDLQLQNTHAGQQNEAVSQADWSQSLMQQPSMNVQRSHDSAFDRGGNLAGSPARVPPFGTSPFSRPGSHSVFFSGDVSDNHAESNFSRSAGQSEDERGGSTIANGVHLQHTSGDGDDVDDVKGEDFLPSSLSDLLTPVELERRRRSVLSAEQRSSLAGAAPQSMPTRGAGPSMWGWDRAEDRKHLAPQHQGSQLSSHAAASPTLGVAGKLEGAFPSSLADKLRSEETADHLKRTSRLGTSNSSAGFLAPRVRADVASHSDQPDIWGQDFLHSKEQQPLDAYSPGAQAALSHAPGQSLPQGLAAGLSRLHLRALDNDTSRLHGASNGGARSRLGPADPATRTAAGTPGSVGAPGDRLGLDDLGPIAPSSVFAGPMSGGLRGVSRIAMGHSFGQASASTSLEALQPPSTSVSGPGSLTNGTGPVFERSPAPASAVSGKEGRGFGDAGGIAIPQADKVKAKNIGSTRSVMPSAAGATGAAGVPSKAGESHQPAARIRAAGTSNVAASSSPVALPTRSEEVEEPIFELE